MCQKTQNQSRSNLCNLILHDGTPFASFYNRRQPIIKTEWFFTWTNTFIRGLLRLFKNFELIFDLSGKFLRVPLRFSVRDAIILLTHQKSAWNIWIISWKFIKWCDIFRLLFTMKITENIIFLNGNNAFILREIKLAV